MVIYVLANVNVNVCVLYVQIHNDRYNYLHALKCNSYEMCGARQIDNYVLLLRGSPLLNALFALFA